MITYPNLLSLLRIFLTPFFLFFFLKDDYVSKIIGTVIFFLASFTDWYDGYLARKYKKTTRFGQFLDPLAHKILVSSALVLFAVQNYIYIWMIVIIVGRDILITVLRIYALYKGKSIITSTFAKWKTFFQMGFVFALLIYLSIPGLADITLKYNIDDWKEWTTITISVVVMLTIASGVHYLIYNRSHVIEIFKRFIRLFQRT